MSTLITTGTATSTGRAEPPARKLVVEGIPIHLVDQGTGVPTLLLHGIFDSADTWQGVADRLRGQVRCLVPDLPGFGRSGDPAQFDAGLPHLAEFIDHLLAAAGIAGPINLAAYDIGATYGLAWAVTHPERVRRLAIGNSNFFSDYTWHPWARLWRIPVLGELIMSGVGPRAFARSLRKAAPTISEEQAQAAGQMITPAAKRMALRHYRALDSDVFRGWEDRLYELIKRVPTLVAWGDRDAFVPPQWAEHFGAQEVQHFAEYGHWLPLEAPDALAARLGSFFGAE